jgi:hypothetical protein
VACHLTARAFVVCVLVCALCRFSIVSLVHSVFPLELIVGAAPCSQDPTGTVLQLAYRRKTPVVTVSMGDGQQPIAERAIAAAVASGAWLLLQVCKH